MTAPTRLAAAAALALALPQPAFAQDKPKDEAKEAPAPAYTANTASKRFTGTFGGQRVAYSATVAEQVLKDEKGAAKAAIVTTSYIAEPRNPNRPVTFLFNGGPGSGSLWLQMGAFDGGIMDALSQLSPPALQVRARPDGHISRKKVEIADRSW